MRYKSKDNLYKLSFDLSYHGLNLLPVKGMSAESVSDDLAAWWDPCAGYLGQLFGFVKLNPLGNVSGYCAGYLPHPPGFFR